MHVHNVPKRLARAFVAPKFAAGVVVTLALLSAACSNDAASRINAPMLLSSSAPAFALISAPVLGTAANFAALGGTGVTCTVPNPPLPAVTVSGGDVGSGSVASTSVTGFPSLCSLDAGRTPLFGQTAAITDLITAYNALRDNNTCPSAIASHNLVGLLTSGSQGSTLAPGVYCITGTGLLTSQLTLRGGPTDIWIFKAATDLTPKNGSVVMAGGATACNVYWQIGTAMDLQNTAFVGNVLAGTAITFTGSPLPGIASSLAGRALAQSDVTMTGANIVACTAGNGNGNGNGDGNDDGDHGHGDKDHGDKDHGDKGHGDKGHENDNHKSDGHSDREGGH
jgi:Ice-binding-like